VTTTQAKRWTIADLERFPQPWDDTRYEIIDGELFVSTQPSNEHQYTCTEVSFELRSWSKRGGGGVVLGAPGLIFADDDNAAPLLPGFSCRVDDLFPPQTWPAPSQ